jgi:hypothetical protein
MPSSRGSSRFVHAVSMRPMSSMCGGFIFLRLGYVFDAFYAFYAWWFHFPQLGALAECVLCVLCVGGFIFRNQEPLPRMSCGQATNASRGLMRLPEARGHTGLLLLGELPCDKTQGSAAGWRHRHQPTRSHRPHASPSLRETNHLRPREAVVA